MKISHWSFAALALAFAALFSAPASAQQTGFYVAGDLGYHAPSQLDSTVVGTDEKWQWGSRDTADGFLRLGYALDSNWRVELEGGYRPSDLSSIRAGLFLPVPVGVKPPGFRLADVSGDTDATTGMANVIYDLPLGLPVQPFIGAGAGLMHLAVKAHGTYPFCDLCLRPVCLVCTATLDSNDSSNRFGFQGEAGFSWPFAPQWALDATYRYVRANGATWDTQIGADLFFGGERFRGNYSDNSVTIGIRYAFGG